MNALNYFVAQKYVEAFGKLADSPQQRTVIVPADFSGIAGSIAGVLELVRGAQGGRPGAARPPAPPRQPPPTAAPPRPGAERWARLKRCSSHTRSGSGSRWAASS